MASEYTKKRIAELGGRRMPVEARWESRKTTHKREKEALIDWDARRLDWRDNFLDQYCSWWDTIDDEESDKDDYSYRIKNIALPSGTDNVMYLIRHSSSKENDPDKPQLWKYGYCSSKTGYKTYHKQRMTTAGVKMDLVFWMGEDLECGDVKIVETLMRNRMKVYLREHPECRHPELPGTCEWVFMSFNEVMKIMAWACYDWFAKFVEPEMSKTKLTMQEKKVLAK